MIEYEIIRSKRKSLSLSVEKGGKVIARAPIWMSVFQIENFIRSKEDWILKHVAEVQKKEAEASQKPPITKEEYAKILKLAKYSIPKRVEYYAPVVGVTYGRITIRNQKTRWGSCSSKGNLNFHLMLVMMPEDIRDYVIVHELCHLKYMNHSKEFWREVEKVIPDYRSRRRYLKENGSQWMIDTPT